MNDEKIAEEIWKGAVKKLNYNDDEDNKGKVMLVIKLAIKIVKKYLK